MYNRFCVASLAAIIIISYSFASESSTSQTQENPLKTSITPTAKEKYEQQREVAKKIAATAHLYHGKAITPDSIKELQPKLDAESFKAINGWILKNANFVSKLVNLPVHGTLEERMKRYEEITAFIKKSGYTNLSSYNFVFRIELPVNDTVKKFALKIAGAANRRENYNALRKREYGSPMTLEEYEEIENKGNATTYQGISRVAHSLLLQEWIEKNPKEGITTPACYLIPIPGANTTVSDKNYVVVEDWVENIGTPTEHPRIFLAHVPALIKAVAHAGLWNISSGQFKITPQHKVACIDLEQPNNTPSSDFFHKNQDKYCGNVGVGLNELATLEQELIEQIEKTKKETSPQQESTE